MGPSKVAKKPFAGRVDLVAAEAVEAAPHDGMVRLDQLGPALIAQLCRANGRVDDVAEKDGTEDRLGLGFAPDGTHEAVDLGRQARHQPG